LRNTKTGDDSGRTGSSWTNSYLHRIGSRIDQIVISHSSANVAGDHLFIWMRFFDLFNKRKHPVRMPMRDVDTDSRRPEIE